MAYWAIDTMMQVDLSHIKIFFFSFWFLYSNSLVRSEIICDNFNLILS